MDREKVIDRIRKLLALATSPNEHEAAVAAAQAQQLLHRYQLSLADVEGRDYVRVNVPLSPWWQAAGRREACGYLCAIVINSSGAVFMQGLDPGITMVVGERTIATGTGLLLEFLLDAVERLAQDAYRARERDLTDPILGRHPALDEPGARPQWLKGYLYGLLGAIASRLAAQQEATAQEVADGSGTALMVVGNALRREHDRVAAWAVTHGAKMSKMDFDSGRVPATAVYEGQAAGERVPLAPPRGALDG